MNSIIKKVVKRIYNFDFSDCELLDGNEIIASDKNSEFVNTFKKRDLDNGIMVTPAGYSKGFVYKSSNNGEIYNNPVWLPDIINFSLDIFGLKTGKFYNITIIGRNAKKFNSITDATNDRSILITTQEKEEIIKYDFTENLENISINGIFRASSAEMILLFRVGKIFISDIIIDEVELVGESLEESEILEENSFTGKITVSAYGIFTTQSVKDSSYVGRYNPMIKLTGKGLNLYFDSVSNSYIIERDNIEEVMSENFTNLNYLVEINTNKIVNKGFFSQYNITEVSPEISPNTLKPGFVRFEFVDDNGQPVNYTGKDGRIAIIVKKIC